MPERSATSPHVAERIWFGILSVLAAVVFAGALITIAAGVPGSCLPCHTQQTKELANSAHTDLGCFDCHGATTTLGIMRTRLNVVDMVGNQLVGGSSSVGAPVDERLCRSCHDTATLSATTEKNGLRMNHRAPIAKGMRCATCHPDSGHRDSAGATGYSMDTCMACHSSNPADIKSCTVCHASAAGGTGESTKATPWRVTHGVNWKKTHGMGDLRTCKGCHAQDFCLRCHNVALPHADGYLGDHGAVAKTLGATGTKGCMTCHGQHSCSNCHGIEMPHPKAFIKVHSKRAVERNATCMRCHTQSSCDECHVRHAHPGLSEELKKKLRANPVNVR